VKKQAKKTISIVVPVYFNELNLPDTIPQLLALAEGLPGYILELIFVDDGSQDRSLEILLDARKQFPQQVKVVKLTRNFGAMAALQAGLTAAHGDCVGVIAADLQDPPELFLEMVRHWENGIKVVFAVRSDRKESFIQKVFSNTYYALIRQFAISGYPPGGSDFFLIDRQIVEEVNKIREKNTNLAGRSGKRRSCSWTRLFPFPICRSDYFHFLGYFMQSFHSPMAPLYLSPGLVAER
jgi:glycosyltransferase involved in cell wall biosynthesis